ncbi:MAG TPA: V-type ATP synthase subunit I, partial [Candidatus Methanoperedens sp.]
MLKPTKMTRVVIAGTKEIMEVTISTLHRLNVLHITDYSEESEDFKIGRPLSPASRYSEYLISLRAISNQLGVAGKDTVSKKNKKELAARFDEKITNLQKEV